ncbi:MAG: ABC transporter permease [Flavobacteriales bacterium]|nr:ABC transporter permease [Flavobacteriales bacterium]
MKILKFLLEKEFKQIFRDAFLPKMIFIVPMIQLLILPLAANFEMRNIHLGIIDHSHSTVSDKMIEKITSSGYFDITTYTQSNATAIQSIEQDICDAIIEIPADFETSLVKENSTTLMISVNAVNGTKGGLAGQYLSNILAEYSAELNGKNVLLNTSTSNLYNPNLNYKTFMVPGIMVFLLTILCSTLSALNIVNEKERGTIEQINVTPISKNMFILSKSTPFMAIGLVVITLSMFIAWIVYGLVPKGSFGLIYLFAVGYILSMTAIGLIIANYSSNTSQAMFIAMFFIMIFVLMSGLFTPVSSMPEWAQIMTYINPARHFIEVIRMIYLKGSTIADVWSQLLTIYFLAIIGNVIAVRTYSKSHQ